MWAHSLREGKRAAIAPRQLSGRGVSYWTDGRGDERIVYVTTGYRLVELNAKTGAPVASFGTQRRRRSEGRRRVRQPASRSTSRPARSACTRRPPSPATSSSSARRSGKGTTVDDAQQHQGAGPRVRRPDRQAAVDVQHHSAAGRVRQRHVGERLVGGQRQHRRVDPDHGRRRRWASSTCRSKTPTSDFYGGHRPGNNLFARSLVCVDLQTGQRKWHFQLVHHPLWNYDISSAPILADITVNGRADQGRGGRRASRRSSTSSTASPASRCGRSRSGRCRSPTCPGEKTSPTQPFPTRPPAYARN